MAPNYCQRCERVKSTGAACSCEAYHMTLCAKCGVRCVLWPTGHDKCACDDEVTYDSCTVRCCTCGELVTGAACPCDEPRHVWMAHAHKAKIGFVPTPCESLEAAKAHVDKRLTYWGYAPESDWRAGGFTGDVTYYHDRKYSKDVTGTVIRRKVEVVEAPDPAQAANYRTAPRCLNCDHIAHDGRPWRCAVVNTDVGVNDLCDEWAE